MERMVNMVSHIKMQQFSFITIYINETLCNLEIISHLYHWSSVIFGNCRKRWARWSKWWCTLFYQILLVIKVAEPWATMIECQNAFVSFQCCALCGGQNIRDYEWYKVQMHVLKVCSVHSIHFLWKSKWMATYMQRLCNNNLQSATKWVETLRPKLGFFTFYELQKEEI